MASTEDSEYGFGFLFDADQDDETSEEYLTLPSPTTEKKKDNRPTTTSVTKRLTTSEAKPSLSTLDDKDEDICKEDDEDFDEAQKALNPEDFDYDWVPIEHYESISPNYRELGMRPLPSIHLPPPRPSPRRALRQRLTALLQLLKDLPESARMDEENVKRVMGALKLGHESAEHVLRRFARFGWFSVGTAVEVGCLVVERWQSEDAWEVARVRPGS